MILKYEIIQTGENTFHVIEEKKPPKTYAEKKESLRCFAIEWQDNFSSFHYSWGDVADYSAFFEEFGRRFGLLKEFRENAIC